MARRKRARKNKEEKRERETGGNACEICLQKVILPTLLASNQNLVSDDKSCQSSNGRQTALFTEFLKDIPAFIFYICFLQTNISLASKNERTGKHYSFSGAARSTFSAVDFHSTDHILAAVGFCCYYSGSPSDCFLSNICSDKQILPRIFYCLRTA